MDKPILYKCVFNYSHEMIVLYRAAYSGRQAKIYAMRQLAKDHGVSYSAVASIFDGSKPNFDITKEVKDESIIHGTGKTV